MTAGSGPRRTSSGTRSARPSGRPPIPAPAEVRDLLKQAADGLREATDLYERALVLARMCGMSHRAIGDAVGKSDTAVRLYLKRRQHD